MNHFRHLLIIQPGTLIAAIGFLISLLLIGCAIRQPHTSPSPKGEGDTLTQPKAPWAEPPDYPSAPKGDVVDILHGVPVSDPWRWLEDSDSGETDRWIDEQADLAREWLHAIPGRESVKSRLTELWDYERFSVPIRRGDRYFFTHNSGLQDQSILHVMDGLTDVEPRPLLDPNTMSEDGTVAITGLSPSPDGSLLAYAISSGGSDWKEWRVRDVETGEDLGDRVRWSKYSGASWDHGGEGFFYSGYDEPEEGTKLTGLSFYQKLYYHRLGTPPGTPPQVVYERPDRKDWGFSGRATDDGRFLAIWVWKGTDPNNAFFYKDLGDPDNPVVELLAEFDATYDFLGNRGNLFYFRTNRDAPLGRLISIDITDPSPEAWGSIVPETEHNLVSALMVGDWLAVSYMEKAQSRIQIFSLDGDQVGEISLPGIGSVMGLGGNTDRGELFFSYTSFNSPTSIHRVDLDHGDAPLQASVFRKPVVPFSLEDYVTRQVFYESSDGTKVSMFISHHRTIQPDGNLPVYLYGYGGFNVPLTPFFSPNNLAWMEQGGVLAIPNLRGGGEYGRDWHLAGTRLHKQNVFDDFIAAAEWLVENRYTTPARLAIGGGSNGGLLVAASMLQRPDLFAAVLPAVGVLDMLRYHMFTIGWAWASDYGTADDPDEFKALLGYSPYHNTREGEVYPATLITTGDHDDRVVPAHSYKFGAALQHAQAGEAPILLRIQRRTGHGAGKPTTLIIDEAADRISFMRQVLGMVAE